MPTMTHRHHVHRRDAVRLPQLSVLEKRVDCDKKPDDPSCQKPAGSTNITIPIVIASVAIVVIAIIVFFVIHRRRVKKQRLEDANDPHKSLDFGMEISGKAGKPKRGVPEMSLTETHSELRRGRGMSMNMESPYLMPAGLNHSRESFHSMSRSLRDQHDPYRPVTFIKGSETGSMPGSAGTSMRSYPRGMRADNASTFTDSSTGVDSVNANLLRNAQRMSRSYPARSESMPPVVPENNSTVYQNSPAPPAPVYHPEHRTGSPLTAEYQTETSPGLLQNDDTARKLEGVRPPTIITPDDFPQNQTPRQRSMEALVQESGTNSYMSDSSYGGGFKITPPSPPRNGPVPPPINTAVANDIAAPPMPAEPEPAGLGVHGFEQPSNRLSLVVRPLPAEDPTEDPESRANRIRSFYKEYFDDSKPEPAGGYDDDNYYYDDYYDGEYYTDGAIFDPETGQFVVAGAPYAEPVTRRAMTPPPRAPPRFRGPGGPGPQGPRGRPGPKGPRGHNSSGSMQYPRGMSAMSHRSAPKKRLPPPSPLRSLPTPHMIKEDSMTFNALDFAPPTTFRDRQAGRRPDSPMGISRPYSPSVSPHVPLASPFNELSAMPSPHALRKSGTFTALDFAPPPRFKNSDNNSDAGSIRSNRSGMSNVQVASLRAGAYRVSRIPKEVVGTTGDMSSVLKPQWDMRGKA